MDTSIVGKTAATAMDGLSEKEGRIMAVAVVVAVEEDDATGYARVEFSTDHLYEQLGLLEVGKQAALNGLTDDE